MGKTYKQIDDGLKTWLEDQKMFFIATSPMSSDGLINCSPKGHDTFRVLSPTVVAYQDLTGSGIETVAHLKENGRIVMDGPASELSNNEDIKEFYLGISAGDQRSFRDVKHYRRRKRWLA